MKDFTPSLPFCDICSGHDFLFANIQSGLLTQLLKLFHNNICVVFVLWLLHYKSPNWCTLKPAIHWITVLSLSPRSSHKHIKRPPQVGIFSPAVPKHYLSHLGPFCVAQKLYLDRKPSLPCFFGILKYRLSSTKAISWTNLSGLLLFLCHSNLFRPCLLCSQ